MGDVRVCFECKEFVPSHFFSNNQWCSKGDSARCKKCVSGNTERDYFLVCSFCKEDLHVEEFSRNQLAKDKVLNLLPHLFVPRYAFYVFFFYLLA